MRPAGGQPLIQAMQQLQGQQPAQPQQPTMVQFGAPDPAMDPAQQAPPGQPQPADPGATEADILEALQSYKQEAQEARKSGPNGRDDVWEANWDLYWGRVDYSEKADWQSTEVMPEASQFTDRWAAAMREALNQSGKWYEVYDPGDVDGSLVQHIERFLDLVLGRCGRTADGHPTDFSSVFEDLMKLGAIMEVAATVTWEEDQDGGEVRVEPGDPRQIWLDHTGRGLYRIRSYERDLHELQQMASMVDGSGQPLYNQEAIQQLQAMEHDNQREERENSSGHGQETTSGRQAITIDEYLATIVIRDGTVVARNALVVVANDQKIIRGPEPNPFWHQRDWTVVTPMVSVPFSVYGRSYMEEWSSVARSFIEMTNLILDGTYTSSLNAFAAVPEMLEDPTQLQEGVTPNKLFELEQGQRPQDFFKEIQLGTLPPEAITVWQTLKGEMREGAKLSEISLGQMPNKSDVTATEVSSVQQSSSSMVRSMARTVEARALEPILTLVWQTALQHYDFTDPEIMHELGEDTARMLHMRRAEFQQRKIRFRVRGISSLVDRQAKLQNLLAALNTISSSPILLKEFLRVYSPAKLLEELLRLHDVDTNNLQQSEREQMMRQIMQAQEQVQAEEGEGAPGPGGTPGGGGEEDNPGQARKAPSTEKNVQ